MKKIFLLLSVICTIQGQEFMKSLKISKIIDLTHTLDAKNPTWDGSCGFDLPTTHDHHECASETKYKRQALHLKKTGVGTHIDAPLHCFAGQAPVAALPLENLIVPAIVIDVSSKAASNYIISANDILYFEKKYGKISENSLVIVYTGWSKQWLDSKKYRNANDKEVMQFPSFSSQAAQLLIDRNVAGIAIDTLSPDCPGSGDPVHRIMLSNNKYIIENIANCDQLPPIGAYVIALPIKIESTEAPVRIIALLMKE